MSYAVKMMKNLAILVCFSKYSDTVGGEDRLISEII